MNPYSRLVPRLNGREIEKRSAYYLGLVKKGVAGFIIFGGELETVRMKLKELQAAAHQPLIIASDLEQGLGQQVEGGTIFPPAMAISSALRQVDREKAASILKELYTAFAKEARYAGINTILAPVLDVNTNPENPIIATRAFGEDPATVSFFGCEMVKVLQQNGIAACGKHFPGHGDTETDSHISLPVIRKDLASLERNELVPFKAAITSGVSMVMLGHLSVPALDSSERPASLSEKTVTYLRAEMGFSGTIITDAMNMGGLGRYTEREASLIALNSGVDIILHPADPDAIADYLGGNNCRPDPLKIAPLHPLLAGATIPPDFVSHRKLSDEFAGMAVTMEGRRDVKVQKPFLIILNDEGVKKGEHLVAALKRRYVGLEHRQIFPGDDMPRSVIPPEHDLLVAVFSQVRAWKGQTAEWLREMIGSLDGKTTVFISFGNPYVLRNVQDTPKIYAYWDSWSAQEAVVEKISL